MVRCHCASASASFVAEAVSSSWLSEASASCRATSAAAAACAKAAACESASSDRSDSKRRLFLACSRVQSRFVVFPGVGERGCGLGLDQIQCFFLGHAKPRHLGVLRTLQGFDVGNPRLPLLRELGFEAFCFGFLALEAVLDVFVTLVAQSLCPRSDSQSIPVPQTRRFRAPPSSRRNRRARARGRWTDP